MKLSQYEIMIFKLKKLGYPVEEMTIVDLKNILLKGGHNGI